MDNKALYKLTHGLYVVGVKNGEGFGGCIVDAVAQVSAGNTPNIIVSSMLKNFTNELIKKEQKFTLSILGKNVDPFVIANFGFQSARTVDKWKNIPHSLVEGLPVANDAVSYLRLKVTNTTELETHSMFLCDIVDAWVGENASDPLVYEDYQKDMKSLTMDAFNKFKEGQK